MKMAKDSRPFDDAQGRERAERVQGFERLPGHSKMQNIQQGMSNVEVFFTSKF
jgi:hypothetical protein